MGKLFKKKSGAVTVNADYAAEISATFAAGTEGYIREIDAFISEAAEELMAELGIDSPIGKTGQYSKSWTDEKTQSRVIQTDGSGVSVTNHSISNTKYVGKKQVPLSNILEFGKINARGKVVGKRPHVFSAADKAEKKIFSKLEEN